MTKKSTKESTNPFLVYLCDVDQVTEEEGLKVVLEARDDVAVFQYEGGFHVIDDRCSHGHASLSDGEVDGCEVECPFHAGAFNFITGEPTAAPCTIPMRVYKTQVSGGKLYLVLSHV